MKSTASLRWIFVCMVMTLLCVCTFAATARAQQTGDTRQPDFPGLDIQAEPWWDGHLDLSAPVPFSFLISNYSQDTIEGELTLTNPESGQILNLGEIFVGQNSVRRFSTIQAVPGWDQCLATFRHEGRVLWQRVLILTTGKDFSEDVNYVLFVDDGSRRLQLPISENAGSENASSVTGRFVPELGQGRAVQPLAVKTWQIPQHPGPLTVAQAIVFSEATKLEMLNEAQWDAVGKWICLGGTVFVSENSADIVDRLKKASPLGAQPGIVFEELTVYRCGTGSIREYAGPLFSATDLETPRQIAVSASRLSRNNTMSILSSWGQEGWENRNSEITRMWVVLFFLIYSLLSSSVLFFYRMTRRNVMVFTSSVVGLSCIAAVILGVFLRSSRGDLSWVTVTSAGSGGLLQLGRIHVQSAGGRNTQLTVQGRHADLQLSESGATANDNYYGYYSFETTQSHFPAFTWQPSQLTDENDAYKISIPINPWGRRQLYATAWQSLERRVEIEITYSPPLEESSTVTGLIGSLNLKATSSLPFNLENCRLVIGMSQAQVSQEGTSRNRGFTGYGYYETHTSSGVQFIQIVSIADFGTLSPTVPVNVTTAPGTWMSMTARDDQYWRNRGQFIPQVPYSGATSIWIVAKIAKSPILSIDEQRSDFEPMQEQHWYVQEILPEQIPPEWLELTQRLLQEQIKTAETQAAAELEKP